MQRGGRTDTFVNYGAGLATFSAVAMTSVGAVAIMDLNLTMGALIAANMLTSQILGPFNQLVGSWRNYSSFRQAVERLGSIFVLPEERTEMSVQLDRPRGEITLASDRRRCRYTQVFGHPPDPAQMTNPPIAFYLVPETLDTGVREAMQRNPTLSVATRQAAQARQRQFSARAGYFPALDLVGSYNWEADRERTPGIRRDYSVALQATWSLFSGFSTRASVAEAAFNYSASLNNEQFIARQIEQEVRLVWQCVDTLRPPAVAQQLGLDRLGSARGAQPPARRRPRNDHQRARRRKRTVRRRNQPGDRDLRREAGDLPPGGGHEPRRPGGDPGRTGARGRGDALCGTLRDRADNGGRRRAPVRDAGAPVNPFAPAPAEGAANPFAAPPAEAAPAGAEAPANPFAAPPAEAAPAGVEVPAEAPADPFALPPAPDGGGEAPADPFALPPAQGGGDQPAQPGAELAPDGPGAAAARALAAMDADLSISRASSPVAGAFGFQVDDGISQRND